MFPLEHSPEKIGNRTRVEILANILRVASSGALKTHIMYKANLSHRQLVRYLTFLEERGLLSEFLDQERGTRQYQITEKGIQFLKDYSNLSAYLETASA